MESEKALNFIRRFAVDRFDIDSTGRTIEDLHILATEELSDRRVVRLRRIGAASAGWRTVLIVSVEGREGVRSAARWAADTRDALGDPEFSDLYLIIKATGVSDHELAAVEADDKFCRRFVSSGSENWTDTLSRTFLGSIGARSAGDATTEPLSAALASVAQTRPWLDSDMREKWRAALLSGETGSDLADKLTSTLAGTGNAP